MRTSRFTSIARPVHTIVTMKAMSSRAKRGVKIRVRTGAMFSITLCFASTSQRGDHGGADGAARHDPVLEVRLHLDADRLEDADRHGHEHAPAQRDQDVVDEQLAGEADEVHPPVAPPPLSADVGDAHGQPQRDGQVEHREDEGVSRLAFRREGEGERVHRDSRRREDRGQRQPAPQRERPVPREVRGDEGKREEADVAGVERPAGSASNAIPNRAGILIATAAATARPRATHIFRDQPVASDSGAAVPFVAGQDELLPETVRMLPGEFPCQGVDGPDSLDGHQEGFVVGEPVGAEGRRSAHGGDLPVRPRPGS